MRNWYKTVIIIAIICILGCNDKKTNNLEKLNSTAMEKFDVKTFNDKKSNNAYEYMVNDTIIKLYEEDECFKKELSANGNHFKHTFSYDKTTNSLVSEFSYFYSMPIGVFREYDKKGNLIKWKNYDEIFDFTVKDLIIVLKKDLKIDLTNDIDKQYESLSISRDSDKCVYYISMPTKEGSIRLIEIDGKTGIILADRTNMGIE